MHVPTFFFIIPHSKDWAKKAKCFQVENLIECTINFDRSLLIWRQTPVEIFHRTKWWMTFVVREAFSRPYTLFLSYSLYFWRVTLLIFNFTDRRINFDLEHSPLSSLSSNRVKLCRKKNENYATKNGIFNRIHAGIGAGALNETKKNDETWN